MREKLSCCFVFLVLLYNCYGLLLRNVNFINKITKSRSLSILTMIRYQRSVIRHTKLNCNKYNSDIDSIEDDDGSPNQSDLTGSDQPIIVDVDDMVNQWIEKRIKEGKQEEKGIFSLKSAVDMAMSAGYPVELVNSTFDKLQNVDKSVTYITEEQLQSLWKANLHRDMSTQTKPFSVYDSLLLVEDEDINEQQKQQEEGEHEVRSAEDVSQSLSSTTTVVEERGRGGREVREEEGGNGDEEETVVSLQVCM